MSLEQPAQSKEPPRALITMMISTGQGNLGAFFSQPHKCCKPYFHILVPSFKLFPFTRLSHCLPIDPLRSSFFIITFSVPGAHFLPSTSSPLRFLASPFSSLFPLYFFFLRLNQSAPSSFVATVAPVLGKCAHHASSHVLSLSVSYSLVALTIVYSYL